MTDPEKTRFPTPLPATEPSPPAPIETVAAARLTRLANAFRVRHGRPVTEPEVARFLARARAERSAAFELRASFGFRFARFAAVFAAAAALVAVVAVGVGPWRQNDAAAPNSSLTAALPSPSLSLRSPVTALVRVIPGALFDGANSSLAVTPDSAVAEADVFETGPDQTLDLRDPDTAAVHVAAETTVTVARWRPREAVLDIDRGAVRSVVNKRRTGERYEVRTPYALIRVVGTDFTVRHVPGEETVVIGHEGLVRVFTPDGHELGQVAAGEELHITPPRVALRDDGAAFGSAFAPDDAHQAQAAPAVAAVGDDAPAVPPAAAVLGEGDAPAGVPSAGLATLGVAPTVPSRPRARTRGAVLGAAAPTRATLMGESDGAATAAPSTDDGGATLGAAAAQVAPSAVPAPDRVQVARELLAAGRGLAAVQLLEGVAQPTRDTERALGDAYLIAGDRDAARAAYRRALAAADDDAAPAALLVDLLRLSDDVAADDAADDTRDLWERYLALYPDGREAPRGHLWLASERLRAGDRAAARPHLRRLLGDFPQRREAAPALALLGRALLDEGHLDAAGELFEAHLDAPGAARAETALVGLLRVRIDQGRAADARALLARYTDRFPVGARAAEAAHLARALAESAPPR